MNDITFTILKVVVSVCSALITVYVIPYIYTLKENTKYASLVEMVDVAVMAAEQTIGAKQGALKKGEVIEFVTKWMNDNGFVISQEQLSQLIEASVFAMKEAQNG